jgi:hypothetical protein
VSVLAWSWLGRIHTVVVQGNAVFALILALLVSVLVLVMVLVLHEVLALCLGKAAARTHNSAKHRIVRLIIVLCLAYRIKILYDLDHVLIVVLDLLSAVTTWQLDPTTWYATSQPSNLVTGSAEICAEQDQAPNSQPSVPSGVVKNLSVGKWT